MTKGEREKEKLATFGIVEADGYLVPLSQAVWKIESDSDTEA